ncbi:hypothetical protein V8G54_007033, partial [Vigna mungo]
MSLAGGEDSCGGRSESLVAACRRRRRNPPLAAFVRRETLGLYFPFLSECEAWEGDPKSSELRALGLAILHHSHPATTQCYSHFHYKSANKKTLGLGCSLCFLMTHNSIHTPTMLQQKRKGPRSAPTECTPNFHLLHPYLWSWANKFHVTPLVLSPTL